jgi:ABC-type phosphate transport system substrate-binding protein
MARNHRDFALAAGLLITATALMPEMSIAQQVIVNRSLAISQLDVPTLRAAFGMRLLEWPDGTRVVPFVMDSNSTVHARFAKQVLQVFPYQLQQAWDRLVFSGTGQAPRVVSSPADMRRRVAQTPGGIGYVPDDYIDESVSTIEVVE